MKTLSQLSDNEKIERLLSTFVRFPLWCSFYETVKNVFGIKASSGLDRLEWERLELLMLEHGLIEKGKSKVKVTALGIRIQQNGGWLNNIKEQERVKQITIDKEERDRLQQELNITKLKWFIRTRWWPLIISGLSLIAAIISIYIAYTK